MVAGISRNSTAFDNDTITTVVKNGQQEEVTITPGFLPKTQRIVFLATKADKRRPLAWLYYIWGSPNQSPSFLRYIDDVEKKMTVFVRMEWMMLMRPVMIIKMGEIELMMMTSSTMVVIYFHFLLITFTSKYLYIFFSTMQSVYDKHKTDRVFWPPLSQELAWYLPTALLAMKGIWTETWISSYFGIIMTTASRKSR